MGQRSILIDRIVDPPHRSTQALAARGAHAISVIAECGVCNDMPHAELARRALASCAALGELGVARGDLVLLAFNPCTDYVALLLGCILRGALPCTVAPPDRRGIAPAPSWLGLVCRLYAPRVVFVESRAARPRADLETPDTPTRVVDLDELRQVCAAGGTAVICAHGPEDLHHVQLTSGSSSRPKAALITHRNVTDNARAIAERVAYDPGRGDNTVSWLPLHHDMGLMTLLCNVYQHAPLLLLPPSSFLRHPLGWIRHLAERRASTTPVPAFALRYCVRRFRADRMAGVDLRHCRTIFVGAERVDAHSLEHFAATFRPYGLAASALQPCYGMAESTLAVTMHAAAGPPVADRLLHVVCDRIDAHAASTEGLARPVPVPGLAPTDTPVSVGSAIPGMACEIRTAGGDPVAERTIGEIVIRGSSLMQGYLAGANEAPARPFDAQGWFRTGDIGYCACGHLYILGRSKDIIIIRGANRFPEDFELVLARHPAVRRGRCVAIGIPDPQDGTEKLVILVEATPDDATAETRAELQSLLQRACGHGAKEIVFVAPRTVPLTTSGKLQRSRCRELYHALSAAAAGSPPCPPPAHAAPVVLGGKA